METILNEFVEPVPLVYSIRFRAAFVGREELTLEEITIDRLYRLSSNERELMECRAGECFA